MDSSDESDWGPIFSIWNLLMILIFGFITKVIYDCVGNREEDKRPTEVTGGSGDVAGGSKASEGSGETPKGDGETDKSKIEKVSQEKEATTKDQDASKKPLGSGDGSSVDKGGDSSSGRKEIGAGDGKDRIENVSAEKGEGLKSRPGETSSGGHAGSSDPVMKKVEDIASEMKDISAEENKESFEQIKPEIASTIAAEKGSIETTATGKGVAGIAVEELKAGNEDVEELWKREQEKKRKEEEERKREAEELKRKEEEAERKRKEEEEKKRKEEEARKKEDEEKKRREEEERKRKEDEEAERKRKEDEEAERKRKEEEERKRKEDEEAERKRKEEEEAERKRKEEEQKRQEEEERKRKEEEEARKKEDEEKKRKDEEDRKRKEEEEKKKQEEELKRKEEEKKKQEEELKRKEEEQKKAEEAAKKLEEEKLKKAEELRLAEEQMKKTEEEMKKKQQEAEDELKRREEEIKKEKERLEAEIKKSEEEAKNEAANKSQGLEQKVEVLKKVESETLGSARPGSDDNGNMETDYVMVSPPRSPMEQTVVPPLESVKKEVSKEEVARKRQQVEDVMAVVSKDKHSSVFDLVDELTTKQHMTTDFDKARALFIWLSSKDLKTLTFINADTGSDEEKLTGLQEGNTTYAQVYQTLCRKAGLECELIHGYAKGVGYKPGMKFEGENFRHSWNAVKVNGEWKLVDPNWGARHVIGKKEGSPIEEEEASDENTVYELDEYYFLPESWELIHSHFPDDHQWQLRQPITKEQFESLVLCKSPFFKHDLRIASHSQAVIKVNKEAEVRITCPEDHKDRLVFIFTLSYADSLNAAEDSHQGTPLGNYGMQRMVGNMSSVIIRPPGPGEYRLVIHVKDLSKPQKVPGKFYYSEVCEYGVLVTEAYPSPRPFPPCAHTSWGKGDSIGRYAADLKPQTSDVVIPTKKGIAEIRFGLQSNLRFLAKLKSASLGDVDRHVMYRVVENEAVFTIKPPENGEYGMEIYANDKERDGTTMHHIYQYLIVAKDIKEKAEPWPQLPSSFLGPQGNFSNFGMKITSHKDPFVTSDSGSLKIEFQSPQPMRLMSQLVYVSEGKQDDVSSYLLQNTTEEAIVFLMELPRSGAYKFSLFGLPANQAADNVPALYNCLIECRHGNESAQPFPKQFSQWKTCGVLVEPTTAQLTGSPSPTPFNMRINNGRGVAVVIGDNWTQLTKQDSGNWTGEVDISQFVGKQSKCVICANMDENEATFSTLLEYSIAN